MFLTGRDKPSNAFVASLAFMAMLLPPVFAFAACSSPAGNAGQMIYNKDYHVLQYCNGSKWLALGPSPGTGGSGCLNPAGAEGIVVYNRDYLVPQYCDGTKWIPTASTGLTHLWKFDESSGATAADSVGTNNGTLVGSPTWQASGGHFGGALQFSGTNYVTVPDSSAVNFGTSSFTIALWVYPTGSVGAYDMPISKGGGSPGNVGYDMELGTGAWGANLADASAVYGAQFMAAPANNTWTHLAMVVDRSANYLKVYVNGAYVTQTSIAGLGTVTGTTPLTFGANSNPTYYFQGRVDDVRMYNRALTNSEIAALYNN